MPAGIQMLDPLHVPRPAHAARILWPRNDEFFPREILSHRNEPLINLWLPVGRIGSHVVHLARIPLALTPSVMVRIYGAIKRHRMPSVELAPQRVEHGPAGETEVDVEAMNLFSAQIGCAALLSQSRDCDGSVNVVERLHGHR